MEEEAASDGCHSGAHDENFLESRQRTQGERVDRDNLEKKKFLVERFEVNGQRCQLEDKATRMRGTYPEMGGRGAATNTCFKSSGGREKTCQKASGLSYFSRPRFT